MIELALCAPVLLLLFFGAVDFGRIFYTSAALTGAAWAGAQYAASQPSRNSDTAGITTAAEGAAQDVLPITVANSLVCRCGSGVEQSCLVSCSSKRTYVRVRVTKSFNTWFTYPFVPQSTLTGYTVTLRVL